MSLSLAETGFPSWLSSATDIDAVLQQPDVACGPVTTWRLDRTQAQTFTPGRSGRLFVVSGRAWITGCHAPLQPVSDLVLMMGHALPLKAGQAVVIESWPIAAEPLLLAWQGIG